VNEEFEAPVEENEREERATNKQHGMCFVNEKEKKMRNNFYAMRRLEKREKLELGLSRFFGFLVSIVHWLVRALH
jgi:hypothetical protein